MPLMMLLMMHQPHHQPWRLDRCNPISHSAAHGSPCSPCLVTQPQASDNAVVMGVQDCGCRAASQRARRAALGELAEAAAPWQHWCSQSPSTDLLHRNVMGKASEAQRASPTSYM